jgi:hypothetical protein
MEMRHNQLVEQTQELTRDLPSRIVDEVLTHVQVEGAVPVTSRGIEALLANALQPITARLGELQQIAAAPPAAPVLLPPEPAARWKTWTWGGRMHPVPNDFKFPNCNVATTWSLWFYGHAVDQIAPYRTFKNFDMISKRDKSYLSRSRKIMTMLCDIAVRDGKVANLESLQRLGPGPSNEIFLYCFEVMMGQSLRHFEGRRVSEISLSCVYNDVVIFTNSQAEDA